MTPHTPDLIGWKKLNTFILVQNFQSKFCEQRKYEHRNGKAKSFEILENFTDLARVAINDRP